MGNWKRYTFSIVSGALVSEMQAIAPCSKMALVVSNMTAWNAGVGNVLFDLTGSTSVSGAAITGYTNLSGTTGVSFLTETSKGVYPLTVSGLFVPNMPAMRIRLGTTITGTTTTFDLITYTETGS